jgi:hypothetical protein
MSAKKKMSEQEIINRYMEGVLSEESMPQSILSTLIAPFLGCII